LEAPPVETPGLSGITVRAAIIAALLMVVCSYWVRQAEVVVLTSQITESVPAIPAVAALMALGLVAPVLRRLSRWLAVSRGEIVLIYCFIAIATSMAGCGIIRFWLSLVPALFYLDTPQNDFASLQQYIPRWFVPQDREVVRTLYEGSEGGVTPWGAWMLPLLHWAAFFLAFWLLLLCVVVLFRRQWVERERLTFPLLYLPLEVLREDTPGRLVGQFFRSPTMWIGFGIASVYNLMNILNAFNPSVICLGKYYNVGSLFVDRPWSAVQPLVIHYRPEMIGLGYLVSLETAFSVWAFYLLNKLTAVLGAAAGYDRAGYPFVQEQSIGAYIAIFIFLVYASRRNIAAVLRKAWTGDPSVPDADEPLPYRLTVVLLVGMVIALSVWLNRAGMAQWVGWLYFALVIAVAVVYARIRAEVGVPLIWMFPFYQQKKLMLNLLGSRPLMVGGSPATLTIFAVLTFMSRGYFPALMGYQIESLKLAREAQVNIRQMAAVVIIAVLVGTFAAYWMHLSSYYENGAGVLGMGGWGTELAVQEFEEVNNYTKAPLAPDVARSVASGVGFVVASVLLALRAVFLRLPLHPLGYAISTAYGDLVWGSFFIVWLAKWLILRLGGMKTYRRLIPAFIGLCLGHFFTAGVLWGGLGAYGGEAFRRYGVWFG
jgi:hypothetical protein